MPTLQTLRNAKTLARLVLAWFALTLGVAMAGSLMEGGSLQLVCSSTGGVKLLSGNGNGNGDAGSDAPSSHGLDCPLCVAVVPPPALATFEAPQPLAQALQPVTAARIAALTAAPPPARGPPLAIDFVAA